LGFGFGSSFGFGFAVSAGVFRAANFGTAVWSFALVRSILSSSVAFAGSAKIFVSASSCRGGNSGFAGSSGSFSMAGSGTAV
jgi:hypothetical protein